MLTAGQRPFAQRSVGAISGGLQQEEVAWQTWRGDRIATETFFYDPSRRGTS